MAVGCGGAERLIVAADEVIPDDLRSGARELGDAQYDTTSRVRPNVRRVRPDERGLCRETGADGCVCITLRGALRTWIPRDRVGHNP